MSDAETDADPDGEEVVLRVSTAEVSPGAAPEAVAARVAAEWASAPAPSPDGPDVRHPGLRPPRSWRWVLEHRRRARRPRPD